MKHILPFTLFLILSMMSTTAQIVNAGFETWVQDGSNCMSPQDWGTLNGSTSILGVCTAQQETTDPHAGSSALMLNTQFIGFPVNQMAPGIATNGTVNTSTQTIEGGQAFTERPVSFTGWYKATPMNGDTYSFAALLINENTGDTVGYTEWSNNAVVSEWTTFTAPVTYFLPDNPTLLQIILLPSDPLNPQQNSVAYFDDLDYYTVTVGVDEPSEPTVRTYPNPVVSDVTFDLGNLENAQLTLYDLMGQPVLLQQLNASQRTISLEQFSNGTYIWSLTSNDDAFMTQGRIVVAK